MFNSTAVVHTDTSALEKQIENYGKQVQLLQDLNINSDKKIDSLKIILEKTSKNINYIQTQLKDEKIKLNTMSDDENILYFHDYIRTYENSRSNSK